MPPTSLRDTLEDVSDSPTPVGPAAGNGGVAPASNSQGTSATDIAQAYRDIVRGEQAASALEANLSKLESRLDELLAGFDALEGSRSDHTVDPPSQSSQQQSGTATAHQNGHSAGGHPVSDKPTS